jgi:hypothetical protein
MPTAGMSEQKVQNAALSLRQLVWLIRQQDPADGGIGKLEAPAAIASMLVDVFENIWKQTLARIHKGVDADKIRTTGAVLSLAGSAWRETFEAIQEVAEKIIRETGEPIRWLSELAEEARRVEEIRVSARRLVDSVNAVFDTHLDPAMLTKSDEDFAAGRFQKDKDVISRLRKSS